MFDTDKRLKNFDDDAGTKKSRTEKNRERKEKAARIKAKEEVAKQLAINTAVAQEEAKVKAAKKKAKAKEKKKAAKGGGKNQRDMSKLTVTKAQFEEELKFTKSQGDTRNTTYNHSGIGKLVSQKSNAMGAKANKAKEIHKAKGTQRGGSGGLL